MRRFVVTVLAAAIVAGAILAATGSGRPTGVRGGASGRSGAQGVCLDRPRGRSGQPAVAQKLVHQLAGLSSIMGNIGRMGDMEGMRGLGRCGGQWVFPSRLWRGT